MSPHNQTNYNIFRQDLQQKNKERKKKKKKYYSRVLYIPEIVLYIIKIKSLYYINIFFYINKILIDMKKHIIYFRYLIQQY